jgi:hypothetical protein
MTTIVRMLAVMALMLAASLAQAQNKVPSERAKPAYDPAPRVDDVASTPPHPEEDAKRPSRSVGNTKTVSHPSRRALTRIHMRSVRSSG